MNKQKQTVKSGTHNAPIKVEPIQQLLKVTDFATLEDIIIDAFTSRMTSSEFLTDFTAHRKAATCQTLGFLLELINGANSNKEVCHA